MKCQKCAKPATFHITDIVEKGKHREFHFCDEHAAAAPCSARRHVRAADQRAGQEVDHGGRVSDRAARCREPSPADKQVCPICQITFLEFRNSGRLGCPYDYEVFRDELMPLLENIHGETRHSGKVPKRAPRNTQQQTTLDPVAQRAQASRRGRRLRGRRAFARQDQGHRAGTGAFLTMSRPGDNARSLQHAPRRVVGPMICQRCHNEATVHLTEPNDGQRRELHLCRACARKAGLALPESRPTWRSTRSCRA